MYSCKEEGKNMKDEEIIRWKIEKINEVDQ